MTNATTHRVTGDLRSRIKELRTVKASTLGRNKANWRMHPDDQQGGLAAMMADVGFVGAVVARELEDGGLELIDGHLRADLADDAEIPVLVTDLTKEEADKILLTYDPLGEMEVANVDALLDLVDSVTLDENAFLKKMVQDIEHDLAKAEKRKKDAGEKDPVMPDMELQPHEHYDYLVVLATSINEWNVLCDRLGLKPDEHPQRKRMGTCRAVHASRLLAKMKDDDVS